MIDLVDFEFLKVSYWTKCKTRNQVREQVTLLFNNLLNIDDIERYQRFLDYFSQICLYIRDYYHGLNQQKLSIWLLLEFERVFPCFGNTLIELLPKFGCWKDLNLVLLEIHTGKDYDTTYKQLENSIYEFIGKTFANDLEALSKGNINNITSLVKFIGKEKRTLDKKIGFTKRFVKQNYRNIYTYSPARALQIYRRDCKSLLVYKRPLNIDMTNNRVKKSNILINTVCPEINSTYLSKDTRILQPPANKEIDFIFNILQHNKRYSDSNKVF